MWRTTTFRLSILFAASFAIGIALLLGMIYFQTTGYLTQRVDNALTAEAEILRASGPKGILQRFQRDGARDPLDSFGLFSVSGQRIAGDTPLAPADLTPDGKPHDVPIGAQSSPARAIKERMPWGEIVIVERDTRQLVEVRNIILGALLWSGAFITILGVTSSILLSARPLRRIQVMQGASDTIASGDFTMRLPRDDSRDELDQLAGITNRMMDEAERLMVQARTIGEGVAHELRTPLTRLRALLEHACHDVDLDDPRGPLLDQCIAETDAVLARFRALLRIAALEARARQVGIETISLNGVLHQVAELYDPMAAERDIALETNYGQREITIRADAELLVEALSCLVDNALKFTAAGGQVALTAFQTQTGAVVEVRDNGLGISAADRPLVTKRFYRGSRNANVDGFGLGLSVVAAVADYHAFELSFHDAKPGTIVRLVCPARRG